MTQHKKHHRIIATIFLLIFFPTLVPTNLFASNNGPNSFEAASFEPVDAADMVNLTTGDMSYVLPLLNVPSPEGGYPLTLSNHAGIAMDQEASWVGLGWGLNPGAINRNTNGYPDDISSGNDLNFVFDQGGQSEFYNVGFGANIFGINAGVGAYWGSNKTFGGSVSLGVGPATVSVGTGTLGTGVGLGYSSSVENLASNISTGVSFKSLKDQGGDLNAGIGYSSSSLSISPNDYNIQSSSKGFSIGAAGFYFYYGHATTKYNLFKEQIDSYNGILYPNATNTGGYLSDTNKLAIYDDGSTNIIDVNDLSKNYLCDNVLLPNYDKYKVQAQGLSGSITPTFIEETVLKHEGVFSTDYFEVLKDEFSHDYKYYPTNIGYYNIDYNTWPAHYYSSIKLNTKIFFEFENTNSSFLRVDRTNILRDPTKESDDQDRNTRNETFRALKYAKTNKTNTFNEDFTNDGISLKNNNRKRVGKFVEVFTNEQILSGTANTGGSFIEAKNLNRNQPQTYRPESIGGYRITDVDGKVYHYSLPVINFEIWYKNFSDPNNEYTKFMERELNVPYATDWLLTAVTGPDYVDTNGNNKVDSADYGYWVEFDYGKWSDGYIWNGSSGKFDIVKGNVRNEDRYEYYRGRKQIYYLDAVRTRTHTAYFVKSIRQDAQGDQLAHYNTQAPNGVGFNKNNNPKILSSEKIGEVGYSSVSPAEKAAYHIPSPLSSLWISGYKQQIRYADFPTHYSLKLDKIILVKNGKLVINKTTGSALSSNTKAYLYENRAFKIASAMNTNAYNNQIFVSDLNFTNLKEIPIHQSENVIDLNDVAGLDIKTNAEKIINFQYDNKYSLMPNSFHSSAANKGKLTLNAVEFLGKEGISCLPKYQFNYYSPTTPFDINTEDGWGYHKNNPAAWSLNEVITPMGSKINIKYESDDYNAVAAKASRVFNKGMSYFITKNSTTNELFFEVTKNTDAGDNTVDDFSVFSDFFKVNETVGLDLFICRRSKYGGKRREVNLNLNEVMCKVTAVNANSVTFKLANSSDYWHFDDEDDGWILKRKFSLTSVKFSDGNNDGVIMRNAGDRNCWGWRNSYDNDDINFHYRLASSTIPNHGKGGGIRVKEISTTDGVNVVNKLNYYYNQTGYNKNSFDFNYKSSGVTSFVPSKEFMILPYASELPPPVIMYSNVSVEESNGSNNLITKTDYGFETLSEYQNSPSSVYNLGNYLVINKVQNDHINILNNTPLVFSKHTIKNRINNLGRLMFVKNYNSSNQLLYYLKNNYYVPQDIQDEFGTKQESFLSYFNTGTNTTNLVYNVNSVGKIWYPNQLVSTSITQGGLSNTTYNDKYDFLTGQVTETRSITSDGKTVKSKTVPAYLKYTEMSSKVDNINNKNMLSQTAANYSYILDNGGWKETGVGITTWSNIWSYKDISGTTSLPAANVPVWRKHQSYVWNGLKDNGIFMNYDVTTGSKDDNFNWTVGIGSQPAQWKQVSETTLYDHYSAPLEMKDINGNLAATKMCDNNSKVLTVSNTGYDEMYFSGAEYLTSNAAYFDGQVKSFGHEDVGESNAHTGKNIVRITTNQNAFEVVLPSNAKRIAVKSRFKVSVWARKGTESNLKIKVGNNIENFNAGETIVAGNWVLLNGYISIPTTATTVAIITQSGTADLDDFRLHPIASSMSSYVYNEWDELWCMIGNNGLATRFEYDAAGRLIKTSSEVIDDAANGIVGGFKVVKTNTYNNRYLN